MPRISYFFGIEIHMYWDKAHHQRPHFHAEYGDDMASVALDGSVLWLSPVASAPVCA